ncbi:MAG: hypothetical protein GY894_10870 [Planctomycetes bacterium]|nr:hypothetical protein [Planctomycetota bacterium]MCP4839840.1 hypothetical protein [Planctomycetota bacterium]
MQLPLCALIALTVSADPWADTVIQFDPGVGGVAGYDDPIAALGPPTRWTGEGTETPMVVSPFSPAWMPDEIVSIGAGGSLTVVFDPPILNDPDNPFGVDMIVFGNAGFIDLAWPTGVCGGIFGADGGSISLSENGSDWVLLDNVTADGPWPTLGWLDAGPYDEWPGLVPSDSTKAMAPTLNVADAEGLGHDELLDLYDGSSGGVGIDIGAAELSAVTAVRIDVSADAFLSVEVDAVVDAGSWNPADLNGDGLVGVDDLLMVIGDWGAASGPGDANGDSTTDVNDLLVVLKAWT